MIDEPSRNFPYFISFLRHKIDHGVKQVDIALSKEVNKKPAYISRLYRGKQKSCPLSMQKDIARFFELSYEQMLSEGREIYTDETGIPLDVIVKKQQESSTGFTEKRSQRLGDLIKQLNSISSGLLKTSERLNQLEGQNRRMFNILDSMYDAICLVRDDFTIEYQNSLHIELFGHVVEENYFEALWHNKRNGDEEIKTELRAKKGTHRTIETEGREYSISITTLFDSLDQANGIVETVRDVTQTKLTLYKLITAELNEGITFFGPDRELVFSSNRWGVLDNISLKRPPSMEELVFLMRKNIINLDEVLDTIFSVYDDKKEGEIDVTFHDGRKFHFRIVPIFRNNVFVGTLVINTPIYRRLTH